MTWFTRDVNTLEVVKRYVPLHGHDIDPFSFSVCHHLFEVIYVVPQLYLSYCITVGVPSLEAAAAAVVVVVEGRHLISVLAT